MSGFRSERDSMGEVQVPAAAYYGPQTQRAVENFPISGWTMAPALLQALGQVKHACTSVNRDLGRFRQASGPTLTEPQIEAILSACREIADGQLDDQFPVDVFQTGSGTSTNMNCNEVIANRAIELSGGDRFASVKSIHPNDHVNLGQSSNDIFPTAVHLAVALQIQKRLIPALARFAEILAEKARQWDKVIKLGRTHLVDASPMRLGQEVGGFARQLTLSVERARDAQRCVWELPVGGTVVGTGLNTHPEFGRRVAERLAADTGIPFVEAANHFEANSQRDALVGCHGALKTIATTLFNVANNLRWLGSGPRGGIYEVQLPDRQPGSSILPGKVNPVMCESVMQVAARVMGNDQTVTFAGAAGGQFQLNVMMPVMAHATLESILLMSNVVHAFVTYCAEGLQANVARCAATVESGLAMVASLNSLLGYDRAAELARQAFASGKTIREVCREQGVLPENTLRQALDPWRMTEPSP